MKHVLRVATRMQVPPNLLLASGVSYVLLVGTLDLAMPAGMHFTLLYLIGIAFVAWRTDVLPPLLLAFASAIFTAIDLYGPKSGQTQNAAILLWNIVSQATVFGGLAWLVTMISGLTRHLEQLVEQRKSQYEAILTTAMDGFVVTDPAGRITDVNDSYCRLVGYSRDELIGFNLGRLEAKESEEDVIRHLSTIKDQGCDRFETRHRRKDGGEVDVEVSVSWLGQSGLLVAFVREIGQRKLADARLRESEARYRSLAESSPDAIFIIDRQLRIEYANSAAAALWRSTPEQLQGCSQEELFAPQIASRHTKIVTEFLKTGIMTRFDEKISVPAGERWIETRLVPVSSANGKIHSIIVICIDISDRKRTEFLLNAQKELGSRLSLTSELPTALNALLEIAMTFEGMDLGGVYLRDPFSGALMLSAHRGTFTPEFLSSVSNYSAEADHTKLVNKGLPFYGEYQSLPVNEPDAESTIKTLAVVPMSHEGDIIGCLNLASRSVDSFPNLSRIGIEVIAGQAAGAIARIRAETERQRLQQQILEITDRQQARIGQEIHDGLCQQLVSLAFDANALHLDLARSGRPEAGVAARIAKYLDEAITNARQLSRGLFPIRLEGDGLISALEELARATCDRFGTQCEFKCPEPLLVKDEAVATHLFRIAQEAVNNGVKHGRAQRINIQLQKHGTGLELTVVDDGVGLKAREPRPGGMGLYIMEYRARSVGGVFRVSNGTTGGTAICCCVPGPASEKMHL